MASNKLEKLGVEELQQKRVKAKNLIGAGIGAWVAFSIVLIISYYFFGELSGTPIIQNLLAGSLMFGIPVWFAYSKLQNIDMELEKREE